MAVRSRSLSVLFVCSFLVLGACTDLSVDDPTPEPESDAGHDVDTSAPDDDADTGYEQPPSDTTTPSEPAALVDTGPDGFILRGTVLAPDEIIEDGEVVIESELIVCVDVDCDEITEGKDYTIIETDGVISPGLIDAHNHLPYNFLPPWFPVSDTFFNNRYEWANEAAYRDHIAPYADNRMSGTHYCPAAKWGELRSLVHATTTIQGQSFQQRCVMGAVRNADHYHDLQHNHLRTTIDSSLNIDADQAQNYIDSFENSDSPTTRLAVHMAEGVSGDGIEDELDAFAGIGSETGHPGTSLLDYGAALLIHAVGITSEQLETISMTDSYIVWSPSSNFHLYGMDVTAPIEEILDYGITTALGPDWTISGAFDMLEEMRIALDYAGRQDIDIVSPEKIWKMATANGAEALGLDEFIGRLIPGHHADIAIFGRHGQDPYRAVIDSQAEDIELVFIDGEVYFGDQHLLESARNDYCEAFDACGAAKFLCGKDSPTAGDRRDEKVSDTRAQLIEILEGRDDAPEEEQYGRGDELLELVICGG